MKCDWKQLHPLATSLLLANSPTYFAENPRQPPQALGNNLTSFIHLASYHLYLPYFAMEKVPSPKMWNTFKTAYHNLQMTMSRNPRAATAPLQILTTPQQPPPCLAINMFHFK
jgi:hypothetical protein